MLRSRSSRIAASALVALALVLSACGGDDDDPTTDDASQTDAGTDDATTDDGSTDDGGDEASADVPDDVCALVSAADVEAITGEAGTTAEAIPGGGCQYKGEDIRSSRYPSVSIAEDFEGAGAIAGARSGAEATLGATAEDLTIGDDAGYVVSGVTLNSTQAAVAHDGLIVTVTLTGGEAATNEGIATELLTAVVDAL